jgi:Ca2+-binding RTX toxin-like protein
VVQTDTVVELAGEGTDLLDFSGLAATDPVTVDLAGTTTTLATHTNRAVVAETVGAALHFENAHGGAGNDLLLGNAADNFLRGNGGNDTLSGGLGANSLDGDGGTNTVREARDTNFTLTTGSLTSDERQLHAEQRAVDDRDPGHRPERGGGGSPDRRRQRQHVHGGRLDRHRLADRRGQQ